ncbi:MAG: DNA gyrase subunit A [Clostridiales bacterium]|jgi:DNA gyrase subunit A|nr:DNA gyrase subunit A [Clostridiales bacterium]
MDENRNDKIIVANIADEMKKSYIDYAMSVIVSRALPDVRDGLKPVHRRILYSMSELNLDYGKPYKKCARITGDVMGKYHPHGNASIYDALVRMAQEFSMRYMLVDGHGNFGSMDGDEAAAERYTEARLSPISMEMITDIEKDTVDFAPNYTEELKEPRVLPARYPNLLVNGSAGIAVGMATNIPPHNLTECIDAVVKIIDNFVEEDRETDIHELMAIVKGPDFPTGASILGNAGIRSAYLTGRGRVVMRGKSHIEPMSGGREMIVVTEVPYQVNKGKLEEKIGELVKDKKIDGISDIRNESDRNGVRMVVELKKDANAQVILNLLYKYTQLQETFGVNMLALVKGEPRVLNLKQILVYYLEHQKEVVARRTQFDLNRAQRRIHLVEGFIKALDFIDEIIAIIRSHRNVSGEDGSKAVIMARFGFTQEQADAIVEMRLRALSGLERERLEDEFKKLEETIAYLKSILEDEHKLLGVIREEILVIRDKFGDARRSEIIFDAGEIDLEDLIDEGMCVITLTHLDYVKRLPLDTYKTQSRGGKGVLGLTTRDEDLIKKIFIASTHDDILFITTAGRAYKLRAYQIPEAGRSAKGNAIVNLLRLNSGEKIAAVIAVSDYESGYLTMLTRRGIIKRTTLSAFQNINKNGLLALNIKEGDSLITALHTTGENDLFIASRKGMGLRFAEADVRAMGRQAAGNLTMRLADDDYLVGAEIVSDDMKLLFVSEMGYGRCTEPEEFRAQNRRGKGKMAYKPTPKTGNLICIAVVNDNEELMLINSNGVIIRIRICDIRTTSRSAAGVKLINLEEGVTVVGLAKIAEEYLNAEEVENA